MNLWLPAFSLHPEMKYVPKGVQSAGVNVVLLTPAG